MFNKGVRHTDTSRTFYTDVKNLSRTVYCVFNIKTYGLKLWLETLGVNVTTVCTLRILNIVWKWATLKKSAFRVDKRDLFNVDNLNFCLNNFLLQRYKYYYIDKQFAIDRKNYYQHYLNNSITAITSVCKYIYMFFFNVYFVFWIIIWSSQQSIIHKICMFLDFFQAFTNIKVNSKIKRNISLLFIDIGCSYTFKYLCNLYIYT